MYQVIITQEGVRDPIATVAAVIGNNSLTIEGCARLVYCVYLQREGFGATFEERVCPIRNGRFSLWCQSYFCIVRISFG